MLRSAASISFIESKNSITMMAGVSHQMRSLRKLIEYEQLAAWRDGLSNEDRPLVATNGCFDMLHPGHLFLLEEARQFGKTLVVGVTGDAAIRALKGPARPVMPERDRVLMLCNLEAVSRVCVFPEVNAVAFLKRCRPDIYIKGGDYTFETLNQEERRLLEQNGVRIEIVPRFENQSSSEILRRIRNGSSSQISG
jgi:rfaE bifunctional protein nucleotidyltransferase chain/domain